MSPTDLTYQKPSAEILALVEAPLPPLVRMNTAGTIAILLHRNIYKSISELSEKEMRLAGLRINPITNISSRQQYYFDFTIKDIFIPAQFQHINKVHPPCIITKDKIISSINQMGMLIGVQILNQTDFITGQSFLQPLPF